MEFVFFHLSVYITFVLASWHLPGEEMRTCPSQRQNAKKRSKVIYGSWYAEIGSDTKILVKAHKPSDGLKNKFLSIRLPSFGLWTTMPKEPIVIVFSCNLQERTYSSKGRKSAIYLH